MSLICVFLEDQKNHEVSYHIHSRRENDFIILLSCVIVCVLFVGLINLVGVFSFLKNKEDHEINFLMVPTKNLLDYYWKYN